MKTLKTIRAKIQAMIRLLRGGRSFVIVLEGRDGQIDLVLNLQATPLQALRLVEGMGKAFHQVSGEVEAWMKETEEQVKEEMVDAGNARGWQKSRSDQQE